MKPGTRIRTTYPVRYGKGFIPPSTEGKVVNADGENTFLIEFADVEIETSIGEVKRATTRASVLVGYFYEIPATQMKKPLS